MSPDSVDKTSIGVFPRPREITFIRLPEVLKRRAKSRTSTFRDIEAGIFPPAVKLGERCSGWPLHEVDALNQAIIAGASAGELRALVRALVATRSAPEA